MQLEVEEDSPIQCDRSNYRSIDAGQDPKRRETNVRAGGAVENKYKDLC